MEAPKLDQLFSSRISSLKFAMAIWIADTVSLVLSLTNEYIEGEVLAYAPRLEIYLSEAGGNIFILIILYIIYRATSQALNDYRLRREMVTASPEIAESYSIAHPLIYSVRDLLYRNISFFAIILFIAFIRGLGYSWLIAHHYGELDLLLPLSKPGTFDPVFDAMVAFLIRQLALLGVNVILHWIFLAWSGLSFFRDYQMYNHLTKKYESETLPEGIRKIEEALEQTRTRTAS